MLNLNNPIFRNMGNKYDRAQNTSTIDYCIGSRMSLIRNEQVTACCEKGMQRHFLILLMPTTMA
uniref:Uncharacterized protein n=1 Tax=Pristionchus pacificus TaxID=54126 RepID=A0A2A6BZ52_PRIPA|eukprot:PDM71051.1 hypothetical protein PRIPAC_44447 [Pristionchus pacificus]